MKGGFILASVITTGITSAISAVGSVISAIMNSETGSWNAILPLIGLAIGFFVCRTGVRIVKSLIQGY